MDSESLKLAQTGSAGEPGRPDRPLPSGSVTFVFTDIEGSTQLLRRHGEHYPELLERHQELLRDAWRTYDGFEIGTEGDAFFVAFERAADAIEACAAAQRDLDEERWHDDATVRVRMGIHTGLAWPRGDNYVAMAVHQAARVVNAAHGGQIVATSDAAEHSGFPINESTGGRGALDPGPAPATLLPLGRFRVRDFDEPVQLLQVAAPGLAIEFPPLRVLPADQHNLVAPPNELVGRDQDLAQLASLIGEANLVTLVGPGGVGKTRLATEYGLLHAPEWSDGVWMVDLTGIREGDLIPEALAAGVGAKVDVGADPWDAVIDHLRDRQALLVVDNCEHLRTEVAQRIGELLRTCPAVRVLATSREPLALREERVWRPDPLAADGAAVEMFVQRAGLGDPSSVDTATIAELCRVLDGLPLAIELAASRCDVLSPTEILEQLRGQRNLLRSRDPTLAERQRSMEATIEWSYQLLDPLEQTTLRRLGAFTDGFELDAATTAVSGSQDPDAVLDEDGLSAYDVPELVWSLASKSLVARELAGGSTRYRMLETIRSFSRRALERSGDTTKVVTSLAGHYVASFGSQVAKLDAGLISDRAREVNNLRGLIPMLAEPDPELAQLVACMVVADVRQSSFVAALAEGRTLLAELPTRTVGRVALLNAVAFVADEAQLPEDAAVLLDEAEALAASVGRPDWLEGRLEQERGIVELLRGHAERARELARSGLADVTSDRGRANLLELLMIAAIELGEGEEARVAGDEALAISQERGDLEACSLLLSSLAEVAWRSGDRALAARRQLESLALAMQTGRRRDIAFALIMAARIAAELPDDATAVRLQGAADRLLAEVGASLYPADSALRDQLLEACRTRLGVEQFDADLSAGAELPIEGGIEAANAVLTVAVAS